MQLELGSFQYENAFPLLHGQQLTSCQWAPLFRGHLARPLEAAGTTTRSANDSLTEVDKEIIKRVQELADKKGWKMSHLALAWINPRISSPIIGFSNIQRMDEALEARGKTLTKEEEKYLE